jgi:uncharacterized protein YndB with AHSA1/START domain
MTTDQLTYTPVHKSISVKAPVERAFQVFTDGIDTWWPRSHHIGKAPLEKNVIEPRVNGRCYGRSIDGTECEWGSILVWEPPRRFVLAWQITPDWQYEPDRSRASEVEVRFTAEPGGSTRVDLEHRHFERHGTGGATIRTSVDSQNGWGGLLQLFATEAERAI